MNEIENVYYFLQNDVKPQVDGFITDLVKGYEFNEHIFYQLGTGGKRWRPGLVFAVSNLCELDDRVRIKLATGIELIHNSTLIHDDIIDNDKYRRGSKSVWREFSKGTAINCGDVILALGVNLLPSSLENLITEKILKIFKGQQMDLEFLGRRDVTVEEYMRMAEGKTGALIELCVEAPQQISGMDLELENISNLGPVFQIQDDILDYTKGKGREIVGRDVIEGKRSLPVVHANCDEVYNILDKKNKNPKKDIKRVRKILENKGSFKFARNKARELAMEVLDSIENLPSSEEKEMLNSVAQFAVERKV